MTAPLTRVAAMLVLSVFGASTALAQVGTNYCTPAVPNSTGAPAAISGSGSAAVHLNDLTLTSSGLPLNAFGFFLTSRDQGSTYPVNNSQGRLCLGGLIGRYVGPGQVKSSGSTGAFSLALDLNAMAHPFSPVVAQAGQTWYFTAWYRDAVGGSATSNFSDGLEVLFTATQPVSGMVPIPAGTFQMGSNAPDLPPYYNGLDQHPVHQVTISYPFWMGQHEVTQAEYQALMGSNPSISLGATRPVEQVNWHQARAYCTALTAQQAGLGNIPAGYEYRLPTEAEWEYACRAGTMTEFHYGPDLFCNEARFWYSDHSNSHCGQVPGCSVPVGSYAPNAFGLYDMHGNVSEWCLDSYAPYASAAVTNPFVTGGPNRIFRGGRCSLDSNLCRSAYRNYTGPFIRINFLGFRAVLAPVLVP